MELPNTSGKKQKYPAFPALADDNGIRKAMTGKKLICKGTCGLKEERIAFEPTTGTEFAQAKSKVQGQMQGLRRAILAELPDEVEFANELVAEIDGLNQELANAVDGAMKTAENEASPATDAIKMKIRKYAAELASNPLVAKADTNPLVVQVTIAKTLGEALGRIREAMPV